MTDQANTTVSDERLAEILGWCDRVRPSAMKTLAMASGLSTLENWYFQALTPDTVRSILTELSARRATADVTEALRELEVACDELAASRGQQTYLSMIDNDLAAPLLEKLDAARSKARTALAELHTVTQRAGVTGASVERILSWVREDVLPAYGISHSTRATDPEMIDGLLAALNPPMGR